MSRPAIQAVVLALVAGIADAVGYLDMGGVFAANMTGNTVLAGIAAAGRSYQQAWHHLAPLAAFFAGAMLSRLLLRLGGRPTMALFAEAMLMAGLGFLPIGPEPRVLILAVAMGLQASAITQFEGVSLSTVVVTSTLARSADALVDRLVGNRRKPALPPVALPWLLALTWTAYLVGALAGAWLVTLIAWPLLVPAALIALLLPGRRR
ncbi:MAG: DUF1275 domain-containing protein [Proteobacteria bacterium]|nr:DUF1275 domain-containing protein [Pseudomonadota bacterium]